MAARPERAGEARLVGLAQEGDEGAFAELVTLHQHGVLSLAMRMVHNRALAEDIAQEAFVRAWRSLAGFRTDATFATWLHRITVNTSLTLKSRPRLGVVRPLESVPDPVDLDPAGDPGQVGDNLALRGRLQAALRQIPDGQRRVVVLKDVEGWSHGEIAEALGITISATKVRLHRGRTRLKRLLADWR